MNKCYYRIFWKNYPDDSTPLNDIDLNRGDVAIDEIDNRVIALDAAKFDKSEAQLLVKYIEYDEDTGIFKITHYNGASYTIDTLLEKLAINFDYDYQTQRLIIELSDGTVKYVDLSALITQYEFLDSDTVHFTISADGKVKADIKEGSIQEKHLRPNYLADIKVESAKAEASAAAADASEKKAKASETAAAGSAKDAASSAASAELSEDNAAASTVAAAGSATQAKASETNAASSATSANGSKVAAAESAQAAASSAASAESSKSAAAGSATAAATSADEAEDYSLMSKSYAVGTNGQVRPNDATDSAKYYYEQSKSISEGLAGALMPMGTVTFANLPLLADAESGWMYNVSDEFTTNSNFKEGAGRVIPAGSNVYKTSDGFWDVLAGSPVTGIKGNEESAYRKGNVNITPANIGALPKNGNAVSATKWSTIRAFDGVRTDGTHDVIHHAVCFDNDSEVNKTAIIQYFSCVTGARFSIKFPGGHSAASLKLNISNTGLKKVTYRNTDFRKTIAAGATYEFVFTGENYELIGYMDDVMVPATDVADGKSGLVPAPPIHTSGKYLTSEATYEDVNDHTAQFTSSDTTDAGATAWTAVAKLTPTSFKNVFAKVSQMFKNVRYLHNLIGNAQLSIGDGTVTGAINEINDNLIGSTIKARYISQGVGPTEYEYTAAQKCELYYSFKIPVGIVSASVTVNDITIVSMGYAWQANTAPFIVPFSCQLNKGDKAKFTNGAGASVNVELQMLVIRS